MALTQNNFGLPRVSPKPWRWSIILILMYVGWVDLIGFTQIYIHKFPRCITSVGLTIKTSSILESVGPRCNMFFYWGFYWGFIWRFWFFLFKRFLQEHLLRIFLETLSITPGIPSEDSFKMSSCDFSGNFFWGFLRMFRRKFLRMCRKVSCRVRSRSSWRIFTKKNSLKELLKNTY